MEKIFEPEMIKFVEKQAAFGENSRTLVSVTDQGHNLFATFDANRDGRLTRRELMEATKHIETWDQDERWRGRAWTKSRSS